jgi:hypothetical protein
MIHGRPLKAAPTGAGQPVMLNGAGPLAAVTFGQLTLWSGRSPILAQLLAYILSEEWPKRTHFHWCISDQMPEHQLCLYLIPAARELMLRGHTVELWQAPGAPTHENTDARRHQHVATLYADAFRRASVNDWFLAIEDDNLPPPRALAQLAQHMRPDRGQIGGVYRIRGAPEYLNCSTTLADPWTPPRAAAAPRAVFLTPMMGAGFTLYNGAAMRRVPPVQCRVTPKPGTIDHVAGWDDWVGRHLAGMGYVSVSDGSLWIEHHTPEVMAYLHHFGIPK